jgi:hypothetical protein
MLGEVRRPSIADLFVAVMSNNPAQAQNAGARITEENAAVR